MPGIDQGIAVLNAEVPVVDVVQEHVDPRQVVRGQVDLLPVEPVANPVWPENLGELQQQRPRPAGRVVDLVHRGLADHRKPGQQFRDLLRGVILPAGLACLRGIHAHEVFVGVPEKVDRVVLEITQRQIADRVQELDEFPVALEHRRSKLGAIDVKVIEQTLQRALGRRADRRPLDVAEYPLQGLVQFLVPGRPLADIGEQL